MMLINFLNKPLSLFDSDILSRCTVSIRLRVEPHCHLDLLLFLLVSAIIIADLTSIQRMHAFVRIATYISVLVQYYMGISLSVEQQLRVLEVRSGRYCVCDIQELVVDIDSARRFRLASNRYSQLATLLVMSVSSNKK